MRIADPERQRQSQANHEDAIERLGVTEETRRRLAQLLRETKEFTPEELSTIKATLPKVGAWLYDLFDKEDRLQSHLEDLMHELQIRLQPVLANTELLCYDLADLPGLEDEHKAAADDVLNSILALDTVIQSMGEFLEEFHFTARPITPLVRRSMEIYAAEASRRAVDLRLHMAPVDGRPPVLVISADHLQYALNNLVHNAVKYSFRGGPDRPRFVRIAGEPSGSYYSIAFENYGVGILPKEIEKGLVFEDGYQGELTKTEHRTGSGKGLHFANRIIRQHRGHIEVSSLPKGDFGESPEGQPHLNRIVVYLPYEQKEMPGA
jgi:signal transduction histidine kinase